MIKILRALLALVPRAFKTCTVIGAAGFILTAAATCGPVPGIGGNPGLLEPGYLCKQAHDCHHKAPAPAGPPAGGQPAVISVISCDHPQLPKICKVNTSQGRMLMERDSGGWHK